MELCCSSSRLAVSNHLPLASERLCKSSFSTSIRPYLKKPHPSLHQKSGFLNLGTPILRATTSEDSTGINGQFENSTGVTATMQEPSDEQLPTVDSYTTSAGPTEESPSDEQFQISDFLDNLNIKLDTEDTTSVVIYASGALVALWLASAVVGAVDSIPLFPKVLELVGLSYTVWFTTRYLIFKKNRDELVDKIEELKQQVIGSSTTTEK